jgi:predicted dehydrogenase
MIKLGYIGLGGRGRNMLKTVLDSFKDVEIAGICDICEERLEQGKEIVIEKTGKEPLCTTNADDILNLDIDCVMIMTYWETHIELAIKAMKKGIRPGIEVGGAYSVEDCFKLVRTYEKTGIPCMMLENCCYGKRELTVLKMVKEGLFGEIVHCSGGYHHYLADEITHGKEKYHYRLRNYTNRNCENYPTHEFGPIAKVLKINRGNRIIRLSSTASKTLQKYENRSISKVI